MGDIITYENLYEVVRKEKSSDALQKLNSNVISQMTDYLRTKIQVYKEAKQKNLPDLEKIRTQVLSARRLIKNLYELRERKIVNLSVTKSRAKSNLEEEENLLDYEKQLLGELCNNITKLRKTVLLNLLNAKTPGSEAEPNKNTQESKPVQNVEEKKLAEVSKNPLLFKSHPPKSMYPSISSSTPLLHSVSASEVSNALEQPPSFP